MKRKILSLILVTVMVLTLIPTISVSASDIEGHWAEEAMSKWSELKWFEGDGAGTYRPNAAITRAEFMALVNRMKGFDTPSPRISEFSDVKSDAWYYNTVAIALEKGYITGYEDGTVRPLANITRQEAMAIVARLEGVSTEETSIVNAASDGASVANWAKGEVAACIINGLIAGSGNKINPATNITRAETVVLLDRVYSNERTYAFKGEYGPEEGTLEIAKLTVSGTGVRVKNMKVKGDLIVTKFVGEGDAWFENIDIGGTVDVEGGGENSIYFIKCHIGKLAIGKDHVRVVFSDDTTVDSVTVSGSDVTVELDKGAEIKTVVIAESADGAKVVMEEGTEIGEITINAPTVISGKGTIEVANIKSEGVVIEKAPVKVNIDAGITAEIAGKEVSGGSTSTGGGGSTTTKPVAVTGVDIATPTSLKLTIAVGDTAKIEAKVLPTTADNQKVEWTIATFTSLTATPTSISPSGLNCTVTGEAAGTAKITVTTDEGGFKKEVEVTVVEQPVVEKFTVTFKLDTADTTPYATKEVESGGVVALPTDPTNPGFTFKGWLVDGTSTQFTASTPVTTNITVIADWEAVNPNAPAAPVITPSSNPVAYGSTATATISSTTTDADIRYTTNGDTPTVTSTLYSGPSFTVPGGAALNGSTTTIKAIAIKDSISSAVTELEVVFSPFSIATDTVAALATGVVAKWTGVAAIEITVTGAFSVGDSTIPTQAYPDFDGFYNGAGIPKDLNDFTEPFAVVGFNLQAIIAAMNYANSNCFKVVQTNPALERFSKLNNGSGNPNTSISETPAASGIWVKNKTYATGLGPTTDFMNIALYSQATTDTKEIVLEVYNADATPELILTVTFISKLTFTP